MQVLRHRAAAGRNVLRSLWSSRVDDAHSGVPSPVAEPPLAEPPVAEVLEARPPVAEPPVAEALEAPAPPARFILQFSTGESVTVIGTGIVGRNPAPEPGEYFDQRIPISDPSKSVSKTHLEFGQDDGTFWINDRHSGNGTALSQPDVPRVRCDAGKRYLVPRGARVDIGDQFFIVS